MARYKNGINGSVKGKVGSVVAATCRGIDYIRSLGESSSKPPTPAQLNQRLKFALVMGWLKPLLKQINIGFGGQKGDQTPMNRAVSFHLKAAVSGEEPNYVIDFPKAILSRGELRPSWIREVSVSSEGLLHIAWEDQWESAFCRADDKANFIIYNPVKGQFATFDEAALRNEQEAALQLPNNFKEDLLHIWMGYVNAKGGMVSTSVYTVH